MGYKTSSLNYSDIDFLSFMITDLRNEGKALTWVSLCIGSNHFACIARTVGIFQINHQLVSLVEAKKSRSRSNTIEVYGYSMAKSGTTDCQLDFGHIQINICISFICISGIHMYTTLSRNISRNI